MPDKPIAPYDKLNLFVKFHVQDNKYVYLPVVGINHTTQMAKYIYHDNSIGEISIPDDNIVTRYPDPDLNYYENDTFANVKGDKYILTYGKYSVKRYGHSLDVYGWYFKPITYTKGYISKVIYANSSSMSKMRKVSE